MFIELVAPDVELVKEEVGKTCFFHSGKEIVSEIYGGLGERFVFNHAPTQSSVFSRRQYVAQYCHDVCVLRITAPVFGVGKELF